jgi:phage tail tape-measure protein
LLGYDLGEPGLEQVAGADAAGEGGQGVFELVPVVAQLVGGQLGQRVGGASTG